MVTTRQTKAKANAAKMAVTTAVAVGVVAAMAKHAHQRPATKFVQSA